MARMLGDDPPYLEVGTEVSAKYRGAFCEAKVRKVVKQVKAKVNLKFNMGSVVVGDDQVKGVLQVGATVEVKHPEKGQVFEGIVAKILDSSQYTVVFDDGDITTLRRTSLHRKSGRHFAEAESLDHLPLTHPEHFSNPVRQRRRGKAHHSDDSSDSESDTEAEGTPTKRQARKTADWLQMVGKVVSVEVDTNKKKKDNWFPALVVVPTAQIDARRDLLVRSFQDGRYYTVPKKEASNFQRDFQPKNNAPLKTAIEKAVNYLERDELPPHWDRDALFGSNDSETNTTASDSESSDEETREEKDHFVAQLYKFMDDRGTPINRAPTVGARDLDLHKLWRVVQKQGGYNKVTNLNVWKTVGSRLTQDAGSPVNTNSVKVAYKRYLLHFEEFQRKLGCTLVSHTRGNKVRSSAGRSLIRERDRTASSGGGSPAPAGSLPDSSHSPSPAPPPAPPTPTVPPGSNKKPPPPTRKKPPPADAEVRRGGSLERRGPVKKNDVREVKQEPPPEEPEVKREEAARETETKMMRTRTKESESASSASPAPSDKSDRVPAKPEAAAASAGKASRERRLSHRAEKASPAPAVAAAVTTEKPQESGGAAAERRRSGPVKRRKDESPDDDDPETLPGYVDVQVGDKVSVLYKINSKKERTIYEAKVLQLDPAPGTRRYFIHYLNWNKRYDEWVKRNRIIENLSWAPTRARRNSRVEVKAPPVSVSSASVRGVRSPAVAAGGSTTPTPEVARTPPGTVPPPVKPTPATAKQEPEKKNNARKGSVAASDSEETEPAVDAGDEVRAPSRRRLQRQRSTPGRSTDDAETEKSTPPRRASRRGVRRTPSKASTTASSSSSEARADDDDSGVGEERTVPGDQAAVVEADSTSEPLPEQPAQQASPPAPVSALSPPALAPVPGAALSDIYEFTDECDDGFVARDTPTKLKSVVNTYGSRASRSPAAAAGDNPAPSPVVTAAPDVSSDSVTTSLATPPPPPASELTSPAKKRKLANKDARSPMASPAKAARRTPTRPARPAGAQTPSPRRPAKKRTAAAAALATPQQQSQPMLAVAKLTDYQLSRVTLVKASSLKPVSPPPPRLQPAASQYKPALKLEPTGVVSVAAPVPPAAAPPVAAAPHISALNRLMANSGCPDPVGLLRPNPGPLLPPPPIKKEEPTEQLSVPIVTAKPVSVTPKLAIFRPPTVSRTSAPAVIRAAPAVTRPALVVRPPPAAPILLRPPVAVPVRPLLPVLTKPPVPAPLRPPQPTLALQPQTTLTAQPQPTLTVQSQPTLALQPQPTLTVQQQPTLTVQPQPTLTVQQQPTLTVQQPTLTVQQQPTLTVQQQPTLTVQQQPTLTVQQQPTLTVQQQPTLTVQSQPTLALQPQPTLTVQQQPTLTVQQQPTLTVQCQPTVALQPEPCPVTRTTTVALPRPPSPPPPAAPSPPPPPPPPPQQTTTTAAPPPPAPPVVSPHRHASGEPAAKRPPRWPSEPEPCDSAERRVAALQSPVKPPCDLTCQETIPGSPERVEGGGRPACLSEPERALEMPFASLPSGVAPSSAAAAGQSERARRQLAATPTSEGSDAGSTGSKRDSVRLSPSGQSPPSLVSSDAEPEPTAADVTAVATEPPQQAEAGAESPPPEVNGVVRSLPSATSLRAPAAAAATVEPINTRLRRRTRRRRRRLSTRSAKGVSDTDEVLDRSNGEPADRSHKYNFLVTFEENEARETRISILTEQIEKLRDRYTSVSAELGRVNRRIKKLKKKQREAPAPPTGDGVKKLRPSFVTP